MKKMFLLCLVVMLIFNSTCSFAEITEEYGELVTEDILSVENSMLIEQTDKKALISFDVKNDTDVYYPSLYYIVTLCKLQDIGDDFYSPKDFCDYDPVEFEISPNQQKTMTYACVFPNNLPKGKYCLAISFYEKSGEISTTKNFIILEDMGRYEKWLEDLEETYLVIDGELNQHISGPNVDANSDVLARIAVKSNMKEKCVCVPKIEIFKRNEIYSNGPVLEKYGSLIEIEAGEEKTIDISLPVILSPESYLVKLCLTDINSTQISEQYSFRYVSTGASANIASIEAVLNDNNGVDLNVVVMGSADDTTLKDCVVEVEARLEDGSIICKKSETMDLGNVSSNISYTLESDSLYNSDKIIVKAKILYNNEELALEEREVNVPKLSLTETQVFSDIVGTKYEKAVMLLNGLGVVNGYPDGTFRPEATITRAEFAAIMTKLNDFKLKSDENSKFWDVVEEHWAKPYINACAENGLVSGYTDGSFLPGNNVKYSESITILINALGYKNEVILSGKGWPDNYISKSKSIGLHKELGNIDFSLPATRGDVAIITMNAYLMK